MKIPDLRQSVNKIRRMDRRELTDRIRQDFLKRWDALLYRAHHDFSLSEISSAPSELPAFFFRPAQVDELIELLRQRVPHRVEQILVRAERILSHRFDLLGFEDLDYGARIDWQLDAAHGKRASLKPFYAVQYLNFAEVGDSKVTWELNRHQHLVVLAKAYRLTGDQRFASELLAQWRDWQASNPYPMGTNWASSLEVGFRSLAWMWVYHLLEGTQGLPADFRREWLNAQNINGRHLERYLSTYFSPNTHLLGEGVALFCIGVLCPELSGSKRWKALGWQIVVKEAQRQVHQDGMHFEHSTYYHVYALDFFLHATILAMLNSVEVPAELEQTMERMLNALSSLCAGGPPPNFGDDDGGRVFDGARNHAEHLLDPLVTGAILFNRPEFRSLTRTLTEESIWLLGAAGVNRWDSLEPKPVPHQSAALLQSGLFLLSNQSSQLTISAGAIVERSRGHDHADALSVCLHGGGKPLLIDPGTYEYVGSGDQRNIFRGTAMHNTLRVDDTDQCEPDGPFSWKQNLHSRAEQWITGEAFTLFVGSHDAYQRLSSPVLHRRWVVALEPGIFLVRDVVEGQGEHRLDLSWHLAPELVVHGEHLFRMKDTRQGLAVLPMCDHDWSVAVQKGVCSPAYGKKSSAVILNYGKTASLPAELVTLLIPLEDVGKTIGRITSFKEQSASDFVHAYRYEHDDLQHTFYFGSGGKPWKSGAVSSDAEFLCLTSHPGIAKPHVVLCQGVYVEIDGIHHFRMNRTVKRFEWTEKGMSCSDPEAMAIPDSNEVLSAEFVKPSGEQ